MTETTKNRLILLTCGLVFFLANLDATIVNVALPSISNTFSINLIRLKDLLIGFLIAYALAIPPLEFIVDRLSLKFVFIAACILFGISSFLCGHAHTLRMLEWGRIVQGMSAGFFVPLSRSVVVRTSEPEKLPLNLSNVQTLGMLGQAIGPLIGSYIISLASWRYIFYVNLPVCGIVVLLMLCFMNTCAEEKPSKYRFDGLGYVFVAVFLATFLYVADALGHENIFHRDNLIKLSLLVLLCIALIRGLRWHIKKYKGKKILDFNLLKTNHKFRLYILLSLISRQYASSLWFLMLIYFSSYRKLLHTDLGYILLSYGCGIWLCKFLLKRLMDYSSQETLLKLSLILLTIFNCITFYLMSCDFVLWIYFGLAFFMGLLVSLFYSCLNILTLVSVTKAKSTPASSIMSLVQYVSQSSAIALISIFFYWINRIWPSHYDVLWVACIMSVFLLLALYVHRRYEIFS